MNRPTNRPNALRGCEENLTLSVCILDPLWRSVNNPRRGLPLNMFLGSSNGIVLHYTAIIEQGRWGEVCGKIYLRKEFLDRKEGYAMVL